MNIKYKILFGVGVAVLSNLYADVLVGDANRLDLNYDGSQYKISKDSKFFEKLDGSTIDSLAKITCSELIARGEVITMTVTTSLLLDEKKETYNEEKLILRLRCAD
ncbi:hypothetical protein KO489_10010 [Reinekea forsetii]|nr:hypothetical protein [Reinekea forsetii]